MSIAYRTFSLHGKQNFCEWLQVRDVLFEVLQQYTLSIFVHSVLTMLLKAFKLINSFRPLELHEYCFNSRILWHTYSQSDLILLLAKSKNTLDAFKSYQYL